MNIRSSPGPFCVMLVATACEGPRKAAATSMSVFAVSAPASRDMIVPLESRMIAAAPARDKLAGIASSVKRCTE